jgi:hypothetical protein
MYRKEKSTMSIAIFTILLSIQTIWISPKTVWSEDLRVSLENEVAGITSEMTLLPHTSGNLDQPDSKNRKPWNSDSAHSSDISLAESRSKLPANPYGSAGFISNDMVPVGNVLKLYDNKLATTGPEKLFINIGRRQGLKLGDKFNVYSEERIIHHPVYGLKGDLLKNERPIRTGFSHNKLWSSTGKPLGHQIAIHGILEVTEVGSTTSYAKVLMAYDEINLGALLTPYQEVVEPLTTNNSDNFLEGYIVATKLDKIGVGITDIVYIDKGWEDGVHAGNVFEVYQIPEIEKKTWYQIGSIGLEKISLLPDVLGELKIVKTEKRTATAVIVQNNYDIHVGYKIRSKR